MFKPAAVLSTLTLALGIAASAQAAEAPLKLEVYANTDPSTFGVASTLITGKTEAILIDAQFTLADAHRVVANVLASGKKLTTVYISHGDPDYYFGLEVITQAFPGVKVVASAPTIAHIKKTLPKKMAYWGPILGTNAPKNPVVPAQLSGNTLTIDGEKLEVMGLDGDDAEHSFVWIPSIRTIAGGVSVFGNFHLWTADDASVAKRAQWLKVLDKMEALKPEVVIPGHFKAGTTFTIEHLQYNREYLKAYDLELAKAKNSAALIAAMKKRYPDAGLGMALEIGAKVNKGEMKW
ncbi:MBL fold metallo-hydrolase [Iodobacter fluviatilis]|jgi:glyoxylase-like metal-dependent hydrolase (beta-lactamase superfamily II)|uniref:MBL fold metallo-hydrolase n=1 Tax=Iodobacter fluviatilis TaxID=537 RepID=A0A7G3G8N0_9NEIS|nr:MBL fold metallo-hydrolase [Iodobacter fluviatilis]QBC43468.1 MBL fold metallo-hydrolase [Iodobacter fluviatilis]